MKVMIAFPPLEGHGTPLLGQNRQFQWFHNPSFIYPMVPASAATLLKTHGHQVIWADAIAERRTLDQFLAQVDHERPDLIALETKTPVVKQHWALTALLKERLHGVRIALMGDHVTALPQETLEHSRADYVLTGGNYDLILDRLVQALDAGAPLPAGVWHIPGGELKFTGEPPAPDLNALPFIDRDLTNWRLYGEKLFKHPPYTYTMAGRDCPWGKCTFCSWTTLYPKFAVRTPENLLDEIGRLIERYGIREIFDDTGTFPGGGWLKTFCEGMVSRGYHERLKISCNFRFDYLRPELAQAMQRAGFRLLKLGLESANQASLDRLCKGTKVEQIEAGCRLAKEAGLTVHLTIMVGHPWETRAEAETTLALARRLLDSGLADMLQSTIMVPYPGTPLYAEAVKRGWLRFAPGDWEKWDMTQTVLTTPDMTPEEVMDLCHQVYRAFATPRFLWRQVAGIRDWEDLKFVARAGKAVLGHLRDFMRKGTK